jgi:hypothetical protein
MVADEGGTGRSEGLFAERKSGQLGEQEGEKRRRTNVVEPLCMQPKVGVGSASPFAVRPPTESLRQPSKF